LATQSNSTIIGPTTRWVSTANILRKLTSRADAGPVKHQHPGHDAQQRPQASQKAAGALERHVVKHGRGDQWEAPAEHVPAETLRCQRATGVAVIRVREVVEHGQVDGEDPDGGYAHRDGRDDPRDGRERCPPEPEHSDGEETTQRAGAVKASFGPGGVRKEPFSCFLDEVVEK